MEQRPRFPLFSSTPFLLRVFRSCGPAYPPFGASVALAFAIYANFFTHHYIGDYRWYLAAVALGLYARSTVLFTPPRALK